MPDSFRENELEENREIMVTSIKKFTNNSFLAVLTNGFQPLMVGLTLYAVIPPEVFQYLLSGRTVLITVMTVISVSSFYQAVYDDTIRNFMTKKRDDDFEDLDEIWLDRVPSICTYVVICCLAIAIYNTSIEISVLPIFNMIFAKFGMWLMSRMSEILAE
jgi:hypothetical protein